MKVRIETMAGKKLIGKRLRMSFACNRTRELWQGFMPSRKKIKNTIGAELFSVEVYNNPFFFRNFNPEAEFEKWAAVEVSMVESVPDDMEILLLPAGLHAVFIHKGPAGEGQRTYEAIFGTWLPGSGFVLDDRPHFALMGEKYKNDDPGSEEEIWIPVKPVSKVNIINPADTETVFPRMLRIPGGEIMLRDDRIKKKWKIEIRPFLLAEYPVTQDFYFKVTGKAPSSFKGDRHPVENVSWFDAILFCNRLSENAGLNKCYTINNDKGDVICDRQSNGYRLPTEAEWEYACRAGSNEVRYGVIDQIAWYKENSGGKTQDVGKMGPNAWGLYDMLGNVWEWCGDKYDEKEYGTYRVFRGGGWADPERGCLASNRRRSHPEFTIDDLGFRIAKSY